MTDLYSKPLELLPLCLWVAEGDEGRVWCFDCNNTEGCHGCPAAHRIRNDQKEYYRPPDPPIGGRLAQA